MSGRQIINEIRQALESTKRAGHQQVFILSLENLLKNLEPLADSELVNAEAANTLENARAKYAHEMKVWEVRTEIRNKLFESVVEAGQSAIKSAIIINGGAAIALLAYLGNIAEKIMPPPLIHALSSSMDSFVSGVALAAFAMGTRYVAQAYYTKEFDLREANPARSGQCQRAAIFTTLLCLALTVASLVAFVYGGKQATNAISSSQPSINTAQKASTK